MARRSKASIVETKAALKVLKAKGLYSGDLRKAPTDYAARLTRQYREVVRGTAQVIRVPKVKAGRATGAVAARKEARSLADAYSLAVRAKGAHLIVKSVSPSDKVIYSPKKKLLEIEHKLGMDYVERIELRKHIELRVQGDGTLELGIRDLKENETYTIPFNRGNGAIQYLQFADKERLLAFLNEYGRDRIDPRSRTGGKIKGWADAADFVSIAHRREIKPRQRKAAK